MLHWTVHRDTEQAGEVLVFNLYQIYCLCRPIEIDKMCNVHYSKRIMEACNVEEIIFCHYSVASFTILLLLPEASCLCIR